MLKEVEKFLKITNVFKAIVSKYVRDVLGRFSRGLVGTAAPLALGYTIRSSTTMFFTPFLG